MRYYLIAFALLLAPTLQAQNISGSWTGLLDAGPVQLHITFNIQKDTNGHDICLMDSPDQSVKGIQTQLNHISKDSLNIAIPIIGATYQGKLSDKTINGTFTQMGRKFTLNLKNEILKYKRPQHPVAPYSYTTQEVKFCNKNAGVTLSGTLTYPVGYKQGDRVPVVLMVSGSGPQNRDSEIFEHKPFLVIADYLAKNGIATLRYDDRAVGKSTGKQQAPTTKEVAEDAQAGIEFLQGQPFFSKVGILGHSEGATVAFMLGAQQSPDFIICLASLGVKGDDCLYAQAKKITELSGHPMNISKEQYVEMALSKPNPWLRHFFDYDPETDIKRTTCPVFALNGDKDCQVIAAQNLTSIEKKLPKNMKSKVKLYHGLNHLFQECTTGLPQEYISIEQTISPTVLKDIADWIGTL